MMARREVLALGAGALLLPRLAFAADEWQKRVEKLLFRRGDPLQGSLMACSTEPGASVWVDAKAVDVSPAGEFVFGISYDRSTSIQIKISLKDGQTFDDTVVPIVRQYQVQAINGLPQNEVTPPPEVLKRIHDEAMQIVAARTRNTPEAWYANGFDWPAAGILSSIYGSQRIDNGVRMAPHLGVDIAAPEGTPIRAPADGIVSLIGPDFVLDGNVTMLDHGQGVSTVYIHQSRIDVKEGERVTRGQVIGAIGRTGRATGPNLHWGLNWFQDKLDPSLSTPTPLPPKA